MHVAYDNFGDTMEYNKGVFASFNQQLTGPYIHRCMHACVCAWWVHTHADDMMVLLMMVMQRWLTLLK